MLTHLQPKRAWVWSILALIATNGLILATMAAPLRFGAAVVLLGFLPGWIWTQAFLARSVAMVEQFILAIGLSLALTVFGALLAVYLPGPLSLTQLLIVINGISLVGLGAVVWSDRSGPKDKHPLKKGVLLGLVPLVLFAAALRLPRLGYAEFHEDEAEALMLGVRLLQGEDYALFLHRKGPAQMLLPVAFWLLADQITETLARFPFALSSILSAATLFLIGRRWLFNWQAGLIAGLLWAFNGYAIGFGRMVQYQALIFFLGPLALYCLYLAWRLEQWRWQLVGAILLATCLLAHFDALLLLPAAFYLGWVGGQGSGDRGQGSGVKGQALGSNRQSSIVNRQSSIVNRHSPRFAAIRYSLLSLLLFLTLLAVFYIPYLLDPEFSNTTTYLTESRVRPGLLYNNLDLLRRFDRDYSSHFFLPILAVGLFSFIGGQMLSSKSTEPPQPKCGGLPVPQNSPLLPSRYPFLSKTVWPWVTAGLILLIASTFWRPELWQVQQFSLAMLPWLLLGLVCFWLAPTVETRSAWLMFGAPLIGYVFLVDDPRTHLYIIYPGAVLLAGAGWSWLVALRPLRYGTVALLTAMTAAVVVYVVAIFLQTESAFTQLRRQWDDSLWEIIYDDVPESREYFGYPKREGWKAIGALRAQGLFPGDFRSVNEDFVTPIWYNFGEARSCYDTPAQFFMRTEGLGAFEVDEAYSETGQVAREGETRLRILSAGVHPPETPPVYPLEDYAPIFDELATPRQFTEHAEPKQPVDTQFGPAISLVGYDLPTPVVAPGETLYVNLYWRALQNPEANYRAFVHLTDGTTLWSQQDDDPACRLPTSIWRAGQHGFGQFRLPIPPNMPAGRYPLIIGLYQANTLERLEITAGAGQMGDDFLWLRDIEVTPETKE